MRRAARMTPGLVDLAPVPGHGRRDRRLRRDPAAGTATAPRSPPAAPRTSCSRWRWSACSSTTTWGRRPATTSAATTRRTWPPPWSRRRTAARPPGGATGRPAPAPPPRSVAAAAMDTAGSWLRRDLGAPSSWPWGRIHRIAFKESTLGVSGIGPLEWYFDTSAVAGGRRRGAVDNTYYRLGRGYPDPADPDAPVADTLPELFDVTNGPSMRALYDMGNLDAGRIITTTGQSGQPFSRHADDWVGLWLRERDGPAAVHGSGDRGGHGGDAGAAAGPVTRGGLKGAMPRDRDLLVGTLAAVVAAALFGMLGPLARFGADAGVPGVAFTAWRAILGASSLAVLIVIRGTAGSSLAAVRGLSTRGRLSLATAAVMGVTLNVSMFTAFGLVPIALALMLFYTYPAGVVVVDVAPGARAHHPVADRGAPALVRRRDPRARRGHGRQRRRADLPARHRAGAVRRGEPGRVRDRQPDRLPGGPRRCRHVRHPRRVRGRRLRDRGPDRAGRRPHRPPPLPRPVAVPPRSRASPARASRRCCSSPPSGRSAGPGRGSSCCWSRSSGVVLAGILLGEAMGPMQAVGGALVLVGALVLQLRSGPPARGRRWRPAAGPVICRPRGGAGGHPRAGHRLG